MEFSGWKPVIIDDEELNKIGFGGLEVIETYEEIKSTNKKKLEYEEDFLEKPKKKKKKQCTVSRNSPSTSTDVKPVTDWAVTDNKEDVSNDDVLIGMEAWNEMFVCIPILRALSECGFTAPTPIQSLTLPSAIKGMKDILGAAETGSGKTLAFGIPILQGIMQEKQMMESIDNTNYLRALILTPTRELAMQVKGHLVVAAKYTGVKTVVIVGGMASQKQERLLARRPDIVVATPGRLWELMESGNDYLRHIHNIKYLAIDETDRMLQKGHFMELEKMLDLINKPEDVEMETKRKHRQTFIFSATLTLVHEIPERLFKNKNMKRITPGQKLNQMTEALGMSSKPKVVDLTREKATSQTLSEAQITCSLHDKDYYLYYFLHQHPGRTLVFCNSIDCVRRLTNVFILLACNPLPLHAQMHQKQRLKSLERFTEDPKGVLIATDVAARGLDIQDVMHVIHYQVPRTSEGYIHRSGRTARALKEGLTLLLIEPAEAQNFLKLCRTLDRAKELPVFPVDSSMYHVLQKRVTLAKELNDLQHQKRKKESELNWFQKAKKELELVSDDSEDEGLSDGEDCHVLSRQKRSIVVKQKQLESLLNQRVLPTQWRTRYPTQCGVPDLEMKQKTALESLTSSTLPRIKITKIAARKKRLHKRRK